MINAAQIDQLLPQTQCGECGFKGCLPYAQALAAGQANIDLCPPGGIKTVIALGSLLEIDSSPYLQSATAHTRPPATAKIREPECIGCTKCIQACPVDAISGAGKHMHSIIGDECTGCGLCVEPCPVDCIELVPLESPQYNSEIARKRYQAREIRILRELHEKQQVYRARKKLAASTENQVQEREAKQSFILAALERAKLKKHHE